MFKNWNNVTLDERNNIVFAGRNQEYGAYELRRNYNRRVTFIVAGMAVFSLILFGAKRFADIPDEEIIEEKIVVEQIDLTPPPPMEELPPPPPPPPPPPMVEMVKFTPPVIKEDAVEEEPQKLQEEVKDITVGTKDQEGEEEVQAPAAVETGPAEAGPEIFTIVEEPAEFPGGFAAMNKYLADKISPNYPAMAREAGISGKCFLKFVVNENGEISNVEVLKGVPGCPDCDKLAINTVKNMPKWKAAKMTGRAVKCYFTLPINFKIQ